MVDAAALDRKGDPTNFPILRGLHDLQVAIRSGNAEMTRYGAYSLNAYNDLLDIIGTKCNDLRVSGSGTLPCGGNSSVGRGRGGGQRERVARCADAHIFVRAGEIEVGQSIVRIREREGVFAVL